MTIEPRQAPIRLSGRSFLAMVLAPEAPLEAWLVELDRLRTRSPNFFSGRAVVLDVKALSLARADLADLVAALGVRGIRVISVEGASAEALGDWPSLTGGRPARDVSMDEAPEPAGRAREAGAPSLLVEEPVRSGQSVVFLEGDVTILGSVASGAEVVAGGSIHVYGALRGRAIAGAAGNGRARIFCRKLEAELLAVDGFYRTADDIDPGVGGRPAQIRLDGGALSIITIP